MNYVSLQINKIIFFGVGPIFSYCRKKVIFSIWGFTSFSDCFLLLKCMLYISCRNWDWSISLLLLSLFWVRCICWEIRIKCIYFWAHILSNRYVNEYSLLERMNWTFMYNLISQWSTWSLSGSQSIKDSHSMSCVPG